MFATIFLIFTLLSILSLILIPLQRKDWMAWFWLIYNAFNYAISRNGKPSAELGWSVACVGLVVMLYSMVRTYRTISNEPNP